MKQMLIISAVLASIFSATFFLINITGILSLSDITLWLTVASEIHSGYLILLVIGLLILDLFIAVPTMSVCILSGYFLGALAGGISAAIGMLLTGLIGYVISYFSGERLLRKIYRNPQNIQDIQQVFIAHSSVLILLCRALPILPELVICLAGINKMPLLKFSALYSLATLPYAFITAFAGSQSSLNDPKPAILAAITVSLILWYCWFLFLRNYRIKNNIF